MNTVKKKLTIIGASGHGKVIADIAKENGYEDIIFFDDNENIKECAGYKVVGKCKDVGMYPEREFIVAIGNAQIRQKIQNMLTDEGLKIGSLIHPKAVVAENVLIGEGTVIMAGAVVNPNTIIGKGCIVNTCASVDHDCIIKDFVHIAVGAHICGSVEIGTKTWIGAGATIINNVKIVNECMIGAGGVVVKDIVIQGVYLGVPVRII